MIRRHLTPAVAFFCCLLSGIFLHKLPSTAAVLFWPGQALMLAALAAGLAGLAIALCAAVPAAIRRTGVLLLSAAVGLGAGAFSLGRMSVSHLRAGLSTRVQDITAFTGTLRQDSLLSRSGDTVLRLRLESGRSEKTAVSGPARGDVLVLCAGDHRFALGERLEVSAGLRPLKGDGSEAFIARAQAREIARKGFAGQAWEIRANARAWVGRSLERAGYPASALLEALISGSREEVPVSLSEGFRRTGTLHVLALSGLHVGIVYGLALVLLSFLRRRGLRIAAASLLLIVYQVFAGFMPSLQRATLMLLAGSLAALMDRDAEPLNLLALSGIVVLGIDPFQAFSVSFQLSYLALAGILVLGPIFRRPLAGWVPPVILVPLSASVGAQIATLPVVLPVFGAWYPSGILASLVLVPLVTAFLALGLVWLMLSPLLHGILLEGFARLFDLIYGLIEGSASLLGRFPAVGAGPSSAAAAAIAAGAVAVAASLLLPRRAPWRAG